VYSIGVLLWVISSGLEPLYSSMKIQSGLRGKIIDGTPFEYSNLYTGKSF
jgi:hypothetical protein